MGRVKDAFIDAGNEEMEAESTLDSAQDTAERFFEPRLKKLGLGKEQISQQDIGELEQSLASVDDAIKNHEAFGVAKIKFTIGIPFIATSSESGVEISILPILLERKRIIVERLRTLKSEQKANNLRGLVEKIKDTDIKASLLEEINQLQEDSSTLLRQTSEIAKETRKEDFRIQAEVARLNAELLERRSKVWQSFLEKESVASIVGSFILVLIAVALVVGMFFGIKSPDIVNNAFLVVLGYFFGQAVSKTVRARKE